MNNDVTNGKPGAGTPGIKRFALRLLVAFSCYRNELVGANAYLPFLPVILDGLAMLWEGL
jgi:hypothetical protein